MGSVGDRWCEHFGFEKNKIIRAPYVVDNDYYKENSKLTGQQTIELKLKYNIPSGNFIFTSVSRFIPVKQIDKQILAFNKLCETSKNNSMIIVGKGQEEKKLKQLTKNNQNIIFAGGLQKQEIAGILGISDCFVLNSSYEPWGLVVNEALGCSLPVICTNMVGAHLDLVKENGIIIDAFEQNEIQLLEAMKKILSINRQELDRMKQKSAEIISGWSYKEAVEGYLKAAESTVRNIS